MWKSKAKSILCMSIFYTAAAFLQVTTAGATEEDQRSYPDYLVTSVAQSAPYSDVFFLWNLDQRVGTLNCKAEPGSLYIDESDESYAMPSQRICREVARSLLSPKGTPRLISLSRLSMTFMALGVPNVDSK